MLPAGKGNATLVILDQTNKQTNKQTNSVALSPQANYTDKRPPLVDEIQCQLLWIEGCRVVSAADPPQSLISVF
jgi:hypothetical protein